MTRPRSTRAAAPRRRARSLNALALQLSALALSFTLVALFVVTSSRAAFVTQTSNPGTNTVNAAGIDLTDNDNDAVMFNVSNLVPGVNEDRCIEVTYTGTVNPQAVRLYTSAAPTGSLATYLNLTIDIGADASGAYSGCGGFSSTGNLYTGTLAAFNTARTNWGNGLTTWDPAGTGETRTFRFRISVQDNALAEGQSATNFGFQWETQS